MTAPASPTAGDLVGAVGDFHRYQPSFHGVDLSALRGAAVDEYFRQPVVVSSGYRALLDLKRFGLHQNLMQALASRTPCFSQLTPSAQHMHRQQHTCLIK